MLRTWQLWRGIKQPPTTHPLYARVMTAPFQVMPWYSACAIILVAPFLLIPAILFTSAFYSLRWAVTIASTLAREYDTGMFDLLALTPAGAFGTSWSISTAAIHRNESLQQIQSPSSWIVRLAFTLLILASLGNFVEPLVPASAEGVMLIFIPLLYLFTLSGALYIDHVQSIVLSALVGMVIPTYARGRVDAGAAAFLVFLLLQVTTYALMLLLGFAALPTLLISLGMDEVFIAVLLPILRLLIFYFLREGIIAAVWAILVERLNVTASEVQTMTR
jgi:hypothetical protein